MQLRTRHLLLAAGVVAVAVAATRARRTPAWATVDDPLGADGVALPSGARTTVVTDDDARLEVLVTGPDDGSTVVLSHCWTGGMSLWGPVARRLVASGHRVVLYDQRGHGRSTLGRAPLTVDRLGDDLRTVLEALDVRDAVLAGHSMGGMTVQALAANHPDVVASRARGIVLAGTAAHVSRVPIPAWAAAAALGTGAPRGSRPRTRGRCDGCSATWCIAPTLTPLATRCSLRPARRARDASWR